MSIIEITNKAAEKSIDLIHNHLSDRGNVKEFSNYLLKETDFFVAPASSKYHLQFSSGLFLHSFFVYLHTLKLYESSGIKKNGNISNKSIFISSFFHDLCKTNFYKQGMKWVKNENTKWKWVQEPTWEVDETIPLGHGEKSLYILQRWFKIELEEACSIRWHMAAWDNTIKCNPSTYDFDKASAVSLLRLLISSDYSHTLLNESDYGFFYDGLWYERDEHQKFNPIVNINDLIEYNNYK